MVGEARAVAHAEEERLRAAVGRAEEEPLRADRMAVRLRELGFDLEP